MMGTRNRHVQNVAEVARSEEAARMASASASALAAVASGSISLRMQRPVVVLPLPFGPEIFEFCSIFGQIAVAASRIGN